MLQKQGGSYALTVLKCWAINFPFVRIVVRYELRRELEIRSQVIVRQGYSYFGNLQFFCTGMAASVLQTE